jgi:hypothetical protein
MARLFSWFEDKILGAYRHDNSLPIAMGSTPTGEYGEPTDEDIIWARQQTVEIIRRARDLDIAAELEEMGR